MCKLLDVQFVWKNKKDSLLGHLYGEESWWFEGPKVLFPRNHPLNHVRAGRAFSSVLKIAFLSPCVYCPRTANSSITPPKTLQKFIVAITYLEYDKVHVGLGPSRSSWLSIADGTVSRTSWSRAHIRLRTPTTARLSTTRSGWRLARRLALAWSWRVVGSVGVLSECWHPSPPRTSVFISYILRVHYLVLLMAAVPTEISLSRCPPITQFKRYHHPKTSSLSSSTTNPFVSTWTWCDANYVRHYRLWRGQGPKCEVPTTTITANTTTKETASHLSRLKENYKAECVRKLSPPAPPVFRRKTIGSDWLFKSRLVTNNKLNYPQASLLLKFFDLNCEFLESNYRLSKLSIVLEIFYSDDVQANEPAVFHV